MTTSARSIQLLTHRHRRAHAALVASALLAAVPAAADAQRADSAWSAPGGVLLRGRDLAALGAFAALSAALVPHDTRVARWSQRPVLQRDRGLRHVMAVARDGGDPGTLLVGVGAYATGLLLRHRPTADIGLHATGAIVASGVVTGALKGLFGRARPYAVGDSNAGDFRLGRGFRGEGKYQSYPSGHTTAAFAFASVIAAETRHRAPGAARFVTPLAYGGATLVGLSRIYHDRHWASDVALGAGIGTITGLTVVRWQHANPSNRIDRRLLPAASLAAPAPGPASGSGATGADDTARRGALPPVTLSWTFQFR